MTEREPYEPSDVRRARRLAEAKASRHSPERLAMVAEMQRRQAEAAAAAPVKPSARAPRSTRPSRKVSAPPAAPQVFGHPVAEWGQLREAAAGRLAEVAAQRRTTDPAELWADVGAATGIELGDPRFKLPRLLTDVGAQGAATIGLLPNALVVESPSTGPGRRFFAHALELGLLADLFLPPSEEFRLTDGLRGWWEAQVTALQDHFAVESSG